MGCDVHMFVEKKEGPYWYAVYRYAPDKWSRDRYPWPDRNNYFAWNERWYWLFGQLAGVRGSGPPIAEPRGMPEDVSDEVKEWMNDPDYHTPSWLTLAELQAHDWLAAMTGDDTAAEKESCMYDIRAWIARLSELNPDPNKVRVVFAFDN